MCLDSSIHGSRSSATAGPPANQTTAGGRLLGRYPQSYSYIKILKKNLKKIKNPREEDKKSSSSEATSKTTNLKIVYWHCTSQAGISPSFIVFFQNKISRHQKETQKRKKLKELRLFYLNNQWYEGFNKNVTQLLYYL